MKITVDPRLRAWDGRTAGGMVRAMIRHQDRQIIEVAKAAGMSDAHLYRVLKGERTLTAEVAIALEGVLGIPAEHLLVADMKRRLHELRSR